MTQMPILTISTVVMPYDNPPLCVQAVMRIFPDWHVELVPETQTFPIQRDAKELSYQGCAPDTFIEFLTQQRILDTALDAMSMNLTTNVTEFYISRQAALAKKISFVLGTELTVGGSICIKMEGDDLPEWLQEITWHEGRREVPREIGDDSSMRHDGSVQEWYDNKGRPTINVED